MILLAAAARVFVERGFHGATVRQIAEQAGYTNPVLYYHFGGKSQLYEQVIQSAFDRLEILVREALDAAHDPIERLRAIVAAHLRFGCEDPVSLRALYVELFRPKDEALNPRFPMFRSWVIERIENVLQEGADRGALPIRDVALARRILVALIGGLLVEQASDPARSKLDASFADTVLNAFLHGIGISGSR